MKLRHCFEAEKVSIKNSCSDSSSRSRELHNSSEPRLLQINTPWGGCSALLKLRETGLRFKFVVCEGTIKKLDVCVLLKSNGQENLLPVLHEIINVATASTRNQRLCETIVSLAVARRLPHMYTISTIVYKYLTEMYCK